MKTRLVILQEREKGLSMSKIHPPFQKIPDAVRTTGLSAYFLRRGCRDGTVPCIKSGSVFYVNIPALLRQLGAESGEK